MIKDIRKIKALAIDFDGVIVNSQQLHLRAWNEVLRQRGVDREITQEKITGLSVLDFIHSLNLPNKSAIDIARAKRENVIEMGIENPPPLYSSVAKTLEQLRREFRLALVSSCEAELVNLLGEYHHILNVFEVKVLEGDYERAKPDPEPYQICLEKLDLPPELVVAIEDSTAGVESAQKAGLFVVAVTNTTQRERLRKADLIIENFQQLLGVFRRNIRDEK